ncbi:hypothetical protein [Geodermatophilus amargosae]|uniref:hypothetical protein n=1 Tax=Geodermatophilus amargosae TaxID=1296565 RepID=UPI0034DEE99F
MDLAVAALGAALLAAAVHLRPTGTPAGRIRRAAARRWRAHVQLWDAVLSGDPWAPRPAAGLDVQPLRWEGDVLRGTVLPGRTC